MGDIQRTLSSVVDNISDENYDQSFAFYRLWFQIAQTYSQNRPDKIFNDIYNTIWPTPANLILRLASDAESDHILAPHCVGLQSRLCSRILRGFFEDNISALWEKGGRYNCGASSRLPIEVNLVAHLANLGYVEETAIRDHILQSLISHPELHDHQADALTTLFKVAGATFDEYGDPSVVDRCLKLLKDHYPGKSKEVLQLRERGWEGLPPPPVLVTRKPKPIVADQRDPAATPVVTSLGLPNPHPQPKTPILEPATTPETDAVPATSATPSPSISIATLSDFTFADASDDDSPVDPATVTPHDTFYLKDGNVEVLCGNVLFRVHTSILSFHSPVLLRMFDQTSLATEGSPDGCPRIVSSDTAQDFATLLKTIYLPGFPEKNKVPDFATFSSLLRITAKYELSTVRSQLLEAIHVGYPTFEGLCPSKLVGESIFSGPIPHPNEVLNLFVQQKVTSALPMAYYMAARRGTQSLMSRDPVSVQLPPDTLQAAIEGLIALREMELEETHHLIFGRTTTHPCSSPTRAPRETVGKEPPDVRRRIVDQITGPPRSGTKVLEVLSLIDVCKGCMEEWESGHGETRKKAWAALPDVFGLKT